MLQALQASSGGQSDQVLSETPVVHEQLWVDKYAPNSFTELLSDEQTNREVCYTVLSTFYSAWKFECSKEFVKDKSNSRKLSHCRSSYG